MVPAAMLVKIPDHVDFQTAAAAMLQGMTAHYLTHSTYPLKTGDTCLVHAAAGGAGGLIVQMAKMLGARVFGTVSTEEKARIAREHGVDEAILYTAAGFRSGSEAPHRRPRRGRGLRFGGQDHFRQEPELAAAARDAGAVRPIERPGAAVRSRTFSTAKGSLFLTRPSLAHYVLTREELLWRAGDVLELGRLRQAEAAHRPRVSAWPKPPPAHRDLEAGRRRASCC